MINVLPGRLAITLAASFFCAAAYSDAQGTFVLTNGYVSNIDAGSNVNFSLTFNQVPDFFTVDQVGRQANGFEFYISTSTNITTTGPFASIIRGDEIHVAGDLRIRNDNPPDTADTNSGGFGSIRGSVPYVLNGQTLTFSVPASVLNVSGPFGYELDLLSYGGRTSYYNGLAGGPIIPPPPPPAPVGPYTITTVARDWSFDYNPNLTYYIAAINNRSQVGGVVASAGTDEFPFPHAVGSKTAQIFPSSAVCVGDVVLWDLNDQGILAGSFAGNAAIFSQAFTNGYTLLDGSHQSVATKIDSVGQAVGAEVLNPPGYPQYVEAVFWHAGQSTQLGTLQSGGCSAAVSLNQRSEIVGFSEPGEWPFQSAGRSSFPGAWPAPASWSTYQPNASAFLWKNGILTNLNKLIPTNSGWVLNVATDINDQGQIVGVGTKAGHQAGFLYYRGTVTDLGLVGTNITVNAINLWGQIVGGVDGRAFIWENGVVRDLNDFLPTGSQWVLEEAADINDLGQVVGVGSLPPYIYLAYIYASRSQFQLTPTSPPGPPSLTMSRQGTNVILSWPTGVVGLEVESATNFVTGGWNTNYPLPVVVAGRYTVTNPITRLFKVYRLFMP
jgi:probable HAF family extracellular repeat protein